MLRVYNRFLNLLIETSSFQSLQMPRNFSGVSNFELHINKHLQGAEHFNKGNIIALDGYKAGVILTREIALDESGKGTENIVVSGYTLDGLMDRRITVPPAHTSHDRKTGTAEEVMKHYVENNFFNPVDENRRLRNFHIAPNQNRGIKIEWESRYKNVAEELEAISLQSGLGWQVFIDFETNQFVFDVYEKRDLTQGNSDGNNPVIFSPEFGTVKSQTLTESDVDYRNAVYVAGQGEGVDRKVIEVGNDIGWERIESFVDARDLSDEMAEEDARYDSEAEENILPINEYEELLNKRGNEKMKEMQSLLSFEADMLTPITRKVYEHTDEGYLYLPQPQGKLTPKNQTITPFEYEVDFDLGDIVSVVNKSWGVDMSVPIVEIIEIHEVGGFRIEATFGEALPTLTKKIKDKFNDIENIDKAESVYKKIEYVDEKLSDVINVIKELEYDEILWTGAAFLDNRHTITPSNKLSECPNGWILIWSRFTNGATVESDFNITVIPKAFAELHSGGGMVESLQGTYDPTDKVVKYFYVRDNNLQGHAQNSAGNNRMLVLRGVLSF